MRGGRKSRAASGSFDRQLKVEGREEREINAETQCAAEPHLFAEETGKRRASRGVSRRTPGEARASEESPTLSKKQNRKGGGTLVTYRPDDVRDWLVFVIVGLKGIQAATRPSLLLCRREIDFYFAAETQKFVRAKKVRGFVVPFRAPRTF